MRRARSGALDPPARSSVQGRSNQVHELCPARWAGSRRCCPIAVNVVVPSRLAGCRVRGLRSPVSDTGSNTVRRAVPPELAFPAFVCRAVCPHGTNRGLSIAVLNEGL